MDKIFVRDYPSFAGKWIYNGYARAFEELGYDVQRYGQDGQGLSQGDFKDNLVMMTDSDFGNPASLLKSKTIESLSAAKQIFMFVSPNTFPDPWGSHPNYVSPVSSNDDYVNALNTLDNITFWTFCEPKQEYYSKWNKVHHVPLAFDKIGYSGKSLIKANIKFDVVYIGSWADNGFNTKKQIMKEIFSAFKESDLNCGFFINKGLSHQEETDLLVNSGVCLNIHDDYQKVLGLDTNERTFKSLGLNGNLVTDFGKHTEHLDKLGLEYVSPQTDNPHEIVELVKERVPFDGWERKRIRNHMKENETYIQRAEQLLEAKNG